MKIKMHIIAISVFVILFGGIGIAMATGTWSTSSDKVPATYKDGAFAGEYNPEDIRGSYTFEEVSTLFKIDLNILYEAFGISKETDGSDMKTKDLEVLYEDAENEIGNGSVQVFVALLKNLPIALDDVYLPEPAIDIIINENSELTKEQLDYLSTHGVEMKEGINDLSAPEEEAEDEEAEDEVAEDEEAEDETLVKGTTTFQQVLDNGISKEQIETIIGGNLPPTNQTIKDYCLASGLSFGEIKEQINSLEY